MNEITQSKNRTHRTYSVAYKAQVVQECHQPGASVAGVALSHGINANLVHRWRKQALCGSLGPVQPVQTAFIPLTLDTPESASLMTANNPDIRVHVQKGNCKIIVNWPVQSAQTCAAWLKEWLA